MRCLAGGISIELSLHPNAHTHTLRALKTALCGGLFILNLIRSVDNWSVLSELNGKKIQAQRSHYYFIAWKSDRNRCSVRIDAPLPESTRTHIISQNRRLQIKYEKYWEKVRIENLISDGRESRRGPGQLCHSTAVRCVCVISSEWSIWKRVDLGVGTSTASPFASISFVDAKRSFYFVSTSLCASQLRCGFVISPLWTHEADIRSSVYDVRCTNHNRNNSNCQFRGRDFFFLSKFDLIQKSFSSFSF